MKHKKIIFIGIGIIAVIGVGYLIFKNAAPAPPAAGPLPLVITTWNTSGATPYATGTWAGNSINTSTNNQYTSQDGAYQLTNIGNTFTVMQTSTSTNVAAGTISGTGSIALS